MLIKKKLENDGYENANVEILLRDDKNNPDQVIVDVNVEKKAR